VAFAMQLGKISTRPNWISDWKSWRYKRNSNSWLHNPKQNSCHNYWTLQLLCWYRI